MPKPKSEIDRDVYQKLYQRARYQCKRVGLRGDALKVCIQERMSEYKELERQIRPLTLEEKQERLKRKFEKVEIEEALRRARETRGRKRFPPIQLPRTFPKDLFEGDESEKSGHEKLTEIMSKTERGMKYKRLMKLIEELEEEENE